jgi:hypothetical protein
LEAAADRGDQPGVLVGDHEAHPGQSSLLQREQEPAPEHFVFAVADVEAQHLAVAVGGDAGGDDHGLGDHLVVVVAHVQIGGVEVHVGELDVVEGPGPEHADDLIDTSADP